MQDPLLQPLDDLLEEVKTANSDFEKKTEPMVSENQSDAENLAALSEQADIDLKEAETKAVEDMDVETLNLIKEVTD